MTDSLVHAPTDRAPATPAPPSAPAPPPERSRTVVEAVIDAVAEPVITPVIDAVDEIVDPDVDAGLVRSLVVGGVVGFVVVYLIALGLFAVVGDYGLATAAGVAVFVGLFGGVGFGAMVGASIR